MWTTPALCLSLLLLASCEAASAILPAAKPVVERTIEVARDPRVADANQDGKTSWGEKLAYILGVGGLAAASYLKANRAQKEVDEQWMVQAQSGQLTDPKKKS